MTRLEKDTVKNALIEYADNHRKLAADYRAQGKMYAASEHESEAGTAAAILTYWREFIDMPFGIIV